MDQGKLFMIMILTVFLIGNVSAAEWDNKVDYENNDLTVIITNWLGVAGWLLDDKIGVAELKSHKTVDEILIFGYGKKEVVMYYDFNFSELYKNGLGNVIFTDKRTNQEIQKNYSFVYWGNEIRERDVYVQDCNKNINGTTSCQKIINGTENYDWEGWLNYNSTDIINKSIRIGLKTYVGESDYVDAVWIIAGKKVSKHSEWAASLNAQLISYLKLDETYGNNTIIDSLGNTTARNNGSTRGVTGIIGNAFDFEDTEKDYINLGDKSLFNFTGSTPFAVSMWIKLESDCDCTLFSRDIGGGTGGYNFKRRSGDNFIGIEMNNAGELTGTIPVETGSFYHVVINFANDNESIWINGTHDISKGSRTATLPDPDSNGTIGRTEATSGEFFDGIIDEVAIFNRSLSPSEIVNLYNNGVGITYRDVFTPTITLNSPIDAFNTSNSTVVFNGTIVDTDGVINVTLYLDGVLNETITTPSSLVGYWNLDDNLADTNVIDGSGNGNDGTANFNTADNSVGGQIKSALEFDGVDDRIFTSTLSNNETRTISSWFKINKHTTDRYYFVCHDLATHCSLGMGEVNTDNLQIIARNSSGSAHAITLSSNILLDTWTHVVAVIENDTTVSGYLNGVKIGTIEKSGFQQHTTSNALKLGYPNDFQYFNGTIDDVRIYNTSLNSTQIQNIYDLGVVGKSNIGSGGDYLFTKVFADGDHNYSYGSCDNVDGCTNISARNFTVDTIAPTLNDAQNITDLVVYTLPTNSTWNYTVNDIHIGSCYYNTSENAALTFTTCNTSAINTTWATGGNKTIQYFANDTFGLETSKLAYLYVYYITYNQTDDPDPVGEGMNVTFNLNVSLTNTPIITATLRLNNTYYNPEITTATTNYYYFEKTIPIPNTYGNLTGYPQLWLWNYTIDGVVTNASTYDTNVTVYELAIDDCSTYGEAILNISLKDEEGNSLVNSSAGSTIEIDLRLTSLSDPTIYLDYNNTWTNVNVSAVCVPTNLLAGSQYKIDFTIGYQATDKVWEFFYLDDGVLNSTKVFNVHTTSIINLMDLITADSTSFLFNFFDVDGLPVDNSIAHVFRKYIGEGLFREVERGKADENGDTVIHLVEEDVIYYFVITDNGDIVYTSSTYTALCQTTPCTIVLEASGDSAEFPTDYDLVPDGNFSINSSLSTRKISVVYNFDTSTDLNFTVYKYESDGNYTPVATDDATGTSGIITLSVPLSAGNVSFFSSVYVDDVFVTSEWVDFSDKATDYFGQTMSLFLAGLLILTLGLIAVSEGAGTIIFVILGVLISSALGLISTSLNTGLSVLIYLILAGGMIIWKLTGGRK